MKVLPKILLPIILLVCFCAGLIYAINNGKLNTSIKHGLQYYLSQKGISAQFVDCQFKDGVLTASEVKIKLVSSVGSINNFAIKMGVTGGISSPKLLIETMPIILTLWDENGEQILQTDIRARKSVPLLFGHDDSDLELNNIKISKIKDIDNKELNLGNARYMSKAESSFQKIEGSLQFGDSLYLNLNNLDEDRSKLHIKAEKIPLMFYKFVSDIFPDNELASFCKEFVRNGYVQSIDIVSDQNYAVENTFGSAKISQLDFIYDKDYPILKDINLDVDIRGSKIKFDIKNGYSSDILLSEGVMFMDWHGRDETLLTINAKGHGSPKSLVDFIAQDQQDAMKKAGIDLGKAQGKVNADVDIKIPLKPGTKNIYNISANIQQLSLNIFKDNVRFHEGDISGIFDGDRVTLGGNGKINGFDSDINFIYNIKDISKFNHKLDIKTRFKAIPKKGKRNTKIAFISLLGGDSIIDIEYVNKDSLGRIMVDADISKLDLYFDKLGIRKNINDPARVVIKGAFSDPTTGSLDFSVTSEKGIKVIGDIILKDEVFQVNLNEIKTKETDLTANLVMKNGLVIVDLKGKVLDLSDADMLQFLEKERDDGATKLNLNINKVKLKNNIWLDDLQLTLECDKDRCFSGYMNSKLGTRLVEMLITASANHEKWLIKCGNAGALLKGIGIYDTMTSGNLIMNINTSRKEVKSGEIIPILDGSFVLDRFVLSETSIMSRLVSFTSFPGLLNIVRGNKNISFTGMTGKFSFTDDVLNIKNSAAEGPYFNFNMKGSVNIQDRHLDITGYVTPELYGVSSAARYVPIIGTILMGNKKHRGIIAAPYHIKERY
jgi:hypothetical protein